MQVGDTLYKRTSTGAIQEWRQEFNEAGGAYRTVSGQKDGKHVTSEWTVCLGKNQGRANATTPEQQAQLEVAANYRKQLAQGGYRETIGAVDDEATFFKPMLAKEYGDYAPDQAQFEQRVVHSQPKLDGIRCILRADGMWSRQGKPIIACPHVFAATQLFFQADPSLILDGELYNHDLKEDFNQIVSLVKKQKPTADNLAESERLIQFWTYDLPAPVCFSQRSSRLFDLVKSHDHPSIREVVTDLVTSQSELDDFYDAYLENGFEGQMVRIDGTGYENKRTKQLLKRKQFQDAEFEIDEVVEGVGNRSGMVGFIRCRLPDGRSFKSNVKGDRAYLRNLLLQREELVGKQVTLKFFRLTPDGIPRFPVVKSVHSSPRM